ncbi:MAG: hypothetical protein M9899_02265 [Bdellovibrionaceae bacterium]|nr:hypothetical protein [Pseudobdellovibrionaceae bacterium]
MSNKERQVFFHNLQQVMTRFEKDFGYAISSEFKGESAFVALKNIFVASYYKPTILKTYPLKPLPKGQFKGWASVIMTNAIL